MKTLTTDQYGAIGLLTIEFNYLEELVGMILAFFLNPEDTDVGDFIVSEQRTFSQKVSMLKGLLEIIALKHNVPKSMKKRASDVLDSATDIASKRNQLVHSIPFHDHQNNVIFLRAKKKLKSTLVPCDVAMILSMVTKTRTIRNNLYEACEPIRNVV